MCEKRSLCQRGSTLQGLQQMTKAKCFVCRRLLKDHTDREHLICILNWSDYWEKSKDSANVKIKQWIRG